MGPYPWTIDGTLIAASPAQTITLPYSFQIVPIPTPAHQLNIDLAAPDFISGAGSWMLTTFSILDNLAILGIFVVLILGARTVWWLYSFITETPGVESLNVSGAIDVATGVNSASLERQADQYEEWAKKPYEPNAAIYRRAAAGKRERAAQWRKAGAISRRASNSAKNLFD